MNYGYNYDENTMLGSFLYFSAYLSLTIENTSFEYNRVYSNDVGWGALLYIRIIDTLILENCSFQNNIGSSSGVLRL